MSPAILKLLGGSALLIYSVEALSRSIQYLSGSRFRSWINLLAGNRFTAILLGLFLSLLLSSSGAVTVMLVGLANARLLSMEQVFAVTLGASVGTTFIVQLFAFNVSEYGLLMIAVGVMLSFFSKTDMVNHAAQGLLFLGMLFFSMNLVMDAGLELEKNEFFQYTITYFRDRPIVSLLISAVFTALIHSSAVTIAFVMSIIGTRHATVVEAIPWVLGANLGTTATAYLASIKGGMLGKRAALGNLFCKIVGVLACFPFIKELGDAAACLSSDVNRQIAHVHTLFNCALAIFFFPFISLGVRVVRKLVPEKETEGPFHFQYLDPKSLRAPELALAQAQREVLRLSDLVEQMVVKSILPFHSGDSREIDALKETDQLVDFINGGIKLFLTKLSQNEMTPEQVQKEFELLLRTNDLENIGDIVDRNILVLIRKHHKKGVTFSKEGWNEIDTFHGKVVECLRLSTAYFTSEDRMLVTKLMLLYKDIEDLVIDYTEQHVQRLHRGVRETLDTTSIHLDLLNHLQRISKLAVNFTRVRGFKSM